MGLGVARGVPTLRGAAYFPSLYHNIPLWVDHISNHKPTQTVSNMLQIQMQVNTCRPPCTAHDANHLSALDVRACSHFNHTQMTVPCVVNIRPNNVLNLDAFAVVSNRADAIDNPIRTRHDIRLTDVADGRKIGSFMLIVLDPIAIIVSWNAEL